MKKQRADSLTVAHGLASNLAEAKRLIMAGLILNREQRVDKPGTLLPADAQLRRKGTMRQYVSRGGQKLAGALAHTKLDPRNMVVLDMGASTGGFTDCLLQGGAKRVFAVDVGTNQLDFSLRQHSAVTVLERTHAKDLNQELIDEALDLVVADVSFTSLRQVLPPVFAFLKCSGQLLVLFKPQFELPREAVGSGGIVKDSNAVTGALEAMQSWFKETGFVVKGCFKSPVKGREGNQEYFFWCTRTTQINLNG